MSESHGSESTQHLPVIEKTAESELGQSASAADYKPLPVLEEADDGEGRFWSARRVPAGILALLVVAGAGLLLYDVAAVRADRPAMHWRRSLADELAERPLDDTWVLVGAGIATALGVWLLVLAATPGLRDVLPMRRAHTDVRAGLHRGAAAMVLRDRAMEVSGVRSVRVRVGRRKVDVRAVSHFRELDDVRADLDATLADGIRGLGLARRPALSVHVARPGRKG
ncbi:hypothetical protein FHS35_004553 [Streptomyces umbrinus]|uniref:DUF6286 domain-containing protein n=1 Tax=Streptomyces TaxID=1883 RepID=UPI00167AC6AD|nr:DUF6286 domain-containing protein [Streptomyces umbrinus]MCR3727679.1 hypothetical protein [Streptomyces umbrinus]MCX4556935.1 DUF6286 domain-containing protein [Streptomyces phaeochromogenes]GHB46156.1 hypothetical protein GCM10010306_044880 [Streptomyces umbrinus]GHH52650.1 hypothetical protein GCM10018775_53140 [Streptomyces umbrinus]